MALDTVACSAQRAPYEADMRAAFRALRIAKPAAIAETTLTVGLASSFGRVEPSARRITALCKSGFVTSAEKT